MRMFGFWGVTLCLVAGALGMPGAILSEYQDSLGQYSFGYSSPESARSEVRSVDGKTRGAFSFVDDSGAIQTARYTADSEGGFRIEASYLPEAPQPVQDTPEVVAAREDHFKAIAEAERLEKAQQTAGIEDSDKLMAKSSGEEQKGADLTMKEDKPGMMVEGRQGDLKEEKVEKSENPQAVVKSSFVMPASKLNLQSRIEMQPMGQSSGAPITTMPQGGISASQEFAGREHLRGAAMVSATNRYSPYSAVLVSPYTAIYPYSHYPFAPAIAHIY